MGFSFETLSDGQCGWVRRAHSHRHHSRRHSHHHDQACGSPSEYVRLPVDEWTAMLSHERVLREANEGLVRDADGLRRDAAARRREAEAARHGLHAVQAEAARLGAAAARLEAHNAKLAAENLLLRQSSEDGAGAASRYHHEADRQRSRADKLELDNAGLRADVGRLKRELELERAEGHRHHNHCSHAHGGLKHKIDELRETVVGWRTRAEDGARESADLRKKVDRMAAVIKDLDDTIASYEKILCRHGSAA